MSLECETILLEVVGGPEEEFELGLAGKAGLGSTWCQVQQLDCWLESLLPRLLLT